MSKAEAIQKFSMLVENVSQEMLHHLIKVAEKEVKTMKDQELIQKILNEDR